MALVIEVFFFLILEVFFYEVISVVVFWGYLKKKRLFE
jgi:hypothetical protein